MNQNTQDLITRYFTEGQAVLASISVTEVTGLINAIESVKISKRVVYLAGNGGSASTASHFATDIGVGSLRRNNPVRVVSLCDNSSVMTALSNDISFDAIFSDQLLLLGQPGDLLIVISASGNSNNLINAVHTANKIGMLVYSLTGFDGGALKKLSNGKNVHVQSKIGAYGLVEDAHLAICHVITECIRTYSDG
jgi:D-sedoheptulose 7-phosphate isomerase